MKNFGLKLLLPLCTPSIKYPHANLPLSFSMVFFLTTLYFGCLVVHVLLLFFLINAPNLNFALGYVVFLVRLNSKNYHCYGFVTKHLRVSCHVEFWEHKPFTSLSMFCHSSTTHSLIFIDHSIALFLTLLQRFRAPQIVLL